MTIIIDSQRADSQHRVKMLKKSISPHSPPLPDVTLSTHATSATLAAHRLQCVVWVGVEKKTQCEQSAF